MSTFTATASLKYWAGSAAAVSGEARSGYYNNVAYSGWMVFSVASLGDMSNVNINSIKLTLTIGSLGGAYTKDIIPTYSGRDQVIGTYSKAGCRNTTWTQTWTTGTNFNNLKAYFEGLTGGKAYLGVVSHGTSRGSGGQAYDYDYLNITKATLELVYGEKKSTGTVGDLKINSANGNSATLKITRYNSNYKHNVTWKIGSHSSTVTQTTSTSVPMLVPPSWLPNATSGTVTVTLETLDANNNSLGSNTYSFKATIEDVAALRPSIGTMDVSPQYTGVSNAAQGWGLYIQNKTKARLSATALSAGAGATLASYQITTSPSYGSASKTGLTGTSTNTTQFDSGTLTSSGSIKITLKVTDSRGRTNEASVTKTIYAYASPMVNNAKAVRCNSSGTEQPTSGTYAKITLDYSCSGVNSNNKVTTVAITVKGKTNTPVSGGTAASGSTSTVIGGDSGTTYGLETDTAYNAEIAVTDKVGTVTKVNVQVPSAAYVIHIRKGGKSMGIGKAAPSTNNKLEIAWPTSIAGDVSAKNGYLGGVINPALFFKDATNTNNISAVYAITDDHRLKFRQWRSNFGSYEDYNLPALNNSSSTSVGYSVLTSKSAVTIGQGGTGQTTAANALAALGTPTSNAAWKNAPVGISHYRYESTTAASDFDLPNNYVHVLVLKYSSTRGVAQAWRWSNSGSNAKNTGCQWMNILHGSTWAGWVQTSYTFAGADTAIGEWTDGKTLYRYCCNGSTISTGDVTTSATLPRTPDNIISIRGAFQRDSAEWRPITFYSYAVAQHAVSVCITTDNKIHLYIGSSMTGTKKWNLIVEYTA